MATKSKFATRFTVTKSEVDCNAIIEDLKMLSSITFDHKIYPFTIANID